MAIYDDFLNPSNLYSRPSQLINGVNRYLSPNKAKLPLDDEREDYLDDVITDDDDVYDPEDPKGPGGKDVYGQGTDLMSKFVKDLGMLDDNQRSMLLKFIGTDGVSPEEYAEFFGVSKDYAPRFQGFSTLADLENQIGNVFAFGEQQKSSEQRAARQAFLSQSLGSMSQGRGFHRMGRGRTASSALARRQMEDTLKQRMLSAEEATSNKYAQLLSSLQRTLTGGFQAASNILQENPTATWGDESAIEIGQTQISGDGSLEYWDGSAWVDEETYLRGQDRDDWG